MNGSLTDWISKWAAVRGDSPAVISEDAAGCPEMLSWRQLDIASARLAIELCRRTADSRSPLVVYGHKSPWMIAAFCACVRSGHAYCPVDQSVPPVRAADIIRSIGQPLVLVPDRSGYTGCPPGSEFEVLTLEEICARCDADRPLTADERREAAALEPVRPDEIHYIIFTSGSSGQPKGVQVTAANLLHFVDWAKTMLPAHSPLTFLNQAPFSFDLSVMDLYLSLSTGGTLYCINRRQIADPKLLYPAIYRGLPDVWVSTPSFAEMAMADPDFDEQRLPNLKTFLFCGETLANQTYDKLQARFPDAAIYNTYGPTETTVAVTGMRITPAISAEYRPLPVGRAKPGTEICVRTADGLTTTEHVRGELTILGDTVSAGYFNRPDLTEAAFFRASVSNRTLPAYKTGDEGYLSGGLIFYCGRIDSQIKLHGYRIELGDIESNLLALSDVQRAAVLPVVRRGRISGLKAYIQCVKPPDDPAQCAQTLKTALADRLPAYMLPGRWVFLNQMPITQNGKIDRRALESMK